MRKTFFQLKKYSIQALRGGGKGVSGKEEYSHMLSYVLDRDKEMS